MITYNASMIFTKVRGEPMNGQTGLQTDTDGWTDPLIDMRGDKVLLKELWR